MNTTINNLKETHFVDWLSQTQSFVFLKVLNVSGECSEIRNHSPVEEYRKHSVRKSTFKYSYMDESSKFSKSPTFKNPTLKHAVCPLYIHSFKFKWAFVFRQTEN